MSYTVQRILLCFICLFALFYMQFIVAPEAEIKQKTLETKGQLTDIAIELDDSIDENGAYIRDGCFTKIGEYKYKYMLRELKRRLSDWLKE